MYLIILFFSLYIPTLAASAITMNTVSIKRIPAKRIKEETQNVLAKIRDLQQDQQQNDEDRDFLCEVSKAISACSVTNDTFPEVIFLRCVAVLCDYVNRMCPERWEFHLNLHSRRYHWMYEEDGAETEFMHDLVRVGFRFNWPSDIFNLVKQILLLTSLDRHQDGYFCRRREMNSENASRSNTNRPQSRYVHINVDTHEEVSPEMLRAALDKPKHEENDPFVLTDVDRKCIRAGGSDLTQNDKMNDMLADFKRLNFCQYNGVKKPGPKCSRSSTLDLVRASGDAFLDRPQMKGVRERIERNIARARDRALAVERGEEFPDNDEEVDISKDPRFIPEEYWREIDKQRVQLKSAKYQAEDTLKKCEDDLKKCNGDRSMEVLSTQKLRLAKKALKSATDAYEAFDREQKTRYSRD
jgi:hypothetical protein